MNSARFQLDTYFFQSACRFRFSKDILLTISFCSLTVSYNNFLITRPAMWRSAQMPFLLVLLTQVYGCVDIIKVAGHIISYLFQCPELPMPSALNPNAPCPPPGLLIAYALHMIQLHASVTSFALFLLRRLKYYFLAAHSYDDLIQQDQVEGKDRVFGFRSADRLVVLIIITLYFFAPLFFHPHTYWITPLLVTLFTWLSFPSPQNPIRGLHRLLTLGQLQSTHAQGT